MDKERIDLDFERLAAPEDTNKEKRNRSVSLMKVICAFFALISLLLHTAIIAEAIEFLRSDNGALLFSQVVPEWEISEPLLPPLPEETTVEDERNDDAPEKSPLFITRDLSTKAEYGLSLTNETAYSPDLYQLLGSDRPSPTATELDSIYGKDSPKVLIYHTHATEAYSDTAGTSFRTSDEERNMISVGRAVTEVLRKAGIGVIHLTEQFDREDWSAAYDNSHSRVLQVLEENPSIQYVFDVHRDCVGSEESGYVRAICSQGGTDTAQLMFVCGTDEGGSGHTGWRSNLSFAVQLQSLLVSQAPDLMRPINLRRASFYQDTSPTSLILECGTCANSQKEAIRAAVYFASSLADYIKGSPCYLDEETLIGTLCP